MKSKHISKTPKSNLSERFKKDYKSDDVFSFIESLEVVLEAGTDISSAITAIAEDTRSKVLKAKLESLSNDIYSGAPLWRSLDKNQLFPQRYIEMIRIGEENGLLLENLQVIVKQYRNERELISKIRSALIYPIIILCIGLVVGTLTAWFVLPKLTYVYSGMDIDLPLITRVLVSTGEFLNQISIWFVIPFTIIVVSSLIFSFRIPRIKRFYEKILLKMPFINKIIVEIEISRIGLILGSLLSVGINVDSSIKALEDSTPYILYKETYANLYRNIESGSSFRKFFEEYPNENLKLPSTVIQMIIAGEHSGNLPEVFNHLAIKYKSQVEITTQNLTVALEPILLLVMWVFVAAIALAVIMPIYSLIGSF
jgi:type II secretory pathway component PulF